MTDGFDAGRDERVVEGGEVIGRDEGSGFAEHARQVTSHQLVAYAADRDSGTRSCGDSWKRGKNTCCNEQGGISRDG